MLAKTTSMKINPFMGRSTFILETESVEKITFKVVKKNTSGPSLHFVKLHYGSRHPALSPLRLPSYGQQAGFVQTTPPTASPMLDQTGFRLMISGKCYPLTCHNRLLVIPPKIMKH